MGDRALRGLLDNLGQFKSAMGPEHHEYLSRGATALIPSIRIDERSERLVSTLDGIIETIEVQRRERLQSRPIDAGKLHLIREQVEQALTSESGGIRVLKDFTITRNVADFPDREYAVGQIKKGYLTEPEMAQEPSNIWEVVTRKVQEFATQYVWIGLSQRPHRTVDVQDEESYLAMLTKEAQPMLEGGLEPVLLVRADIPQMTSKFAGVVLPIHRHGNSVPFVALRCGDFGGLIKFGTPFGKVFHHLDAPLPSFSPLR